MKDRRPRNKSQAPTAAEPDQGLQSVALATALISLCSFLYYLHRGEVLLYGDAVAHINIARRVFDSQTPGLLELGTVWLPLPHLLMIPFLLSDWMWQSGVGGSIPSMIAYVFGAVGIFRLGQVIFENSVTGADSRSRFGAGVGSWVAALVYAANPNLIYMQATAMTESLYLAWFIWAVAYFVKFARPLLADQPSGLDPDRRALVRCAICMAGAELTRYDGWFLAAAMGLTGILLSIRRGLIRQPERGVLRRTMLKFLLALMVAPLLWLAYNAAAYRNPLEFANGPYSAKAIEQRTTPPGAAPHPGTRNPSVALTFFLKAGQLSMAVGNWGRLWLAVALAALVVAIRRKMSPCLAILLLWVPVPFYAASIAYGSVPIFLPPWWPHSHYNVRYGLQLLPLFAVSAGLVAAAILTRIGQIKTRVAALIAAVGLICLSYFFVWRAQPLCWQEAWVNMRSKVALESAVAKTIGSFPPHSMYLMYLGEHVGAFQQAGIPLRQVINEGNHRPWVKPRDPDGLWERALASPQSYVNYVICYEADPADQAVAKEQLTLLTIIHTTGQATARIYATRPTNQSR